jgi:uroporphyrinogen decarboxylase
VNSRERIICIMNHKESDKIPFDLGSTPATGIHIDAYKNLLSFMGVKKDSFFIRDNVQQIVCIDEDILENFVVDTRGIYPKNPLNWKIKIENDKNGNEYFTGQYGIKWKRPKGGKYFDIYNSPLSEYSINDLSNYTFPNLKDKKRLDGLKEEIIDYYNKGYFIFFNGISGGFLEISTWLRGFENFYCDLANNTKFACLLMDKLLEIEMDFWDLVLSEMGDYIDMVYTANDLGGQNGLLISPTMYRKYIKPRQKKLNSFIKKKKKDIFIYYHSCGSIYEIIPDLIEIGVDALNPVQVSAANMDTKKLKKEFGKDITFWGGGVDTQRVLPFGTPHEVKEEVKKRIENLAPGGGFVFSTVHNIQADVPPQNIIAMWEALQEHGKY